MYNDGRKIPREYENPVDNVLIDITHSLNPLYKQLGITPNVLTTFSWVCSILGLWLYRRAPKGSREVYIGVWLYWMSYFFDRAEGNMTRTYNLTTMFGDRYDNLSDVVTNVGIMYVMWKVTPSQQRGKLMMVIAVLCMLLLVQLGCQHRIMYDSRREAHTSSRSSTPLETLETNATGLCKGDVATVADHIRYTRLFGWGTLVVTVCIIMLRMKG